MAKKIWLSMYPRNVGFEQNRPYVRTSPPSSKPGRNSRLNYPRHFGGKSMATKKEKTTEKPCLSFYLTKS